MCEGEGRGLCVGEGQTPSSYTWYVPFLVFDDLNVMFLCEVHCLIPVLPHACVQEIILHTNTVVVLGGGGGGYMYVRMYVPAYVVLHSWTVGTKWEGAIVMPSSSSCH